MARSAAPAMSAGPGAVADVVATAVGAAAPTMGPPAVGTRVATALPTLVASETPKTERKQQ